MSNFLETLRRRTPEKVEENRISYADFMRTRLAVVIVEFDDGPYIKVRKHRDDTIYTVRMTRILRHELMRYSDRYNLKTFSDLVGLVIQSRPCKHRPFVEWDILGKEHE